MIKVIITAPGFSGAPDGEVYPRKFGVGETITGDLACVAIELGFAELEAPPAAVVEPATAAAADHRDMIPDGWRELHHTQRKGIAEVLTGKPYRYAADADAAIEAWLEGNR